MSCPKFIKWLRGGFSIVKLRITPSRLRFWWIRHANRKADKDIKL